MNLQIAKHNTIFNVMNRDVQVLDLSATLADVAKTMVDHSGSVPVLDGENLAGIITETDLIRAFVNECS